MNDKRKLQECVRNNPRILEDTNDEGQTLLFVACKNGFAEIAQFLIVNKASVDQSETTTNESPLQAACLARSEAIVTFLLDKRASIAHQDLNGDTALHTAARDDGCVKILEKLLKAGTRVGMEAGTVNKRQCTPLHIACMNNNSKAARLLLEHHCPLDAQNDYQKTALHVACGRGLFDLVTLLLAHGASVDMKDVSGNTPVDIALEKNYRSLFDAMVPPLAFRACEKGELATLKSLMNDYPSLVNATNKESASLLHVATAHNFLELMRHLLENKCSPHTRDNTQQTALHLACREAKIENVALLVEYGASAAAVDSTGLTPLAIAEDMNSTRIIALFTSAKAALKRTSTMGEGERFNQWRDHSDTVLSKNPTIYSQTSNSNEQGKPRERPTLRKQKSGPAPKLRSFLGLGHPSETQLSGEKIEPADNCPPEVSPPIASPRSPRASEKSVNDQVAQACREGSHTKLAEAFNSKAFVLNSIIAPEGTALHIACAHGQKNLVEKLIKLQVEVDTTNEHAQTSLHVACINNYSSIVNLLVDANACVDKQNDAGDTALHHACSSGNLELVKTLIDGGAATSILNKKCQTPLDLALQQKHQSVVECLQLHQSQMDLNLVQACQDNNLEQVRHLLERGAYVGAATAFKDSLLHLACQTNDIPLSLLLVSYGADLNCRNSAEKTPLHLACVGDENLDLVNILLDLGADPNAIDVQGYSPLSIATQNESLNLKVLLIKRGASEACQFRSTQRRTDSFTSQSAAINGELLLFACQDGDKKLVRECIKANVDLERCITASESPLFAATWEGFTDIVELLLKAGAQATTIDAEKRTPLHVAALLGHLHTVLNLVRYGAAINACDVQDATPLHYACLGGHVPVVTYLLKNKAVLDYQENTMGQAPLHIACQQGHSDIVRLLVENNADVDNKDYEQATPLCIAEQLGFSEIAQILKAPKNELAENKLSPEPQNLQKTTPRNATEVYQDPVLHACYSGDQEALEHLIQSGHKLTAQTEGITPLHIAAAEDHTNIVNVLLSSGVDLNATNSGDNLRRTALHVSAQKNSIEIARSIISQGCDINIRDSNGNRPLHVASQHGSSLVLSELLSQEACKLDAENNLGQTPLHLACQEGHTNIARVLLSQGADVDLPDDDGLTSLHLACRHGHAAIVQLLLLHHADIEAVDNDELTALEHAQQANHVNCANLIQQ